MGSILFAIKQQQYLGKESSPPQNPTSKMKRLAVKQLRYAIIVFVPQIRSLGCLPFPLPADTQIQEDARRRD